ESYRREIAARMAELERQRAFAFRRLNLVRVIAAKVSGAGDEAEAVALGSAAFLREVEWTGATEAQREVVNRFIPVATAIWKVAAPPPENREDEEVPDAARIDRELTAF